MFHPKCVGQSGLARTKPGAGNYLWVCCAVDRNLSTWAVICPSASQCHQQEPGSEAEWPGLDAAVCYRMCVYAC